MHLFEKETNDKYRKRNVFRILQPEFQAADMEDLKMVHTLSISPEDDQLLAATACSQMFSVRLWDVDMMQVHFNSDSIIAPQY